MLTVYLFIFIFIAKLHACARVKTLKVGRCLELLNARGLENVLPPQQSRPQGHTANDAGVEATL